MASPGSPRAAAVVGLLCALALLTAACGDDSGGDGDGAATTTTAPAVTTTTLPVGVAASDTAASALRSELTALLQEQVFLTGITVEQAIEANGNLDARAPSATADVANESASDLGDVIGTAYGLAVGADFLELWNEHQHAVLGYAVGGGTASEVADARTAVIDRLVRADADLDQQALDEAFTASDEELLAAVDEFRQDSPAAADDLRLAADEMPAMALVLATEFDEHSALEGDATGDDAAFRSDLTALFQESVYLLGLGLDELAATSDAADPEVQATFEAVDANAVELAGALEPDDAAARDDVLELWRDHITMIQEYEIATQAGDAPGIDQSRQELEAWRDDLGNALAEQYNTLADGTTLSHEAIAEALVPHVDTILDYADAVAVREPSASDVLREAAAAMPDLARTLAGATAAPVE
jgi:hypothetical protein